jgi:hypothetical protein
MNCFDSFEADVRQANLRSGDREKINRQAYLDVLDVLPPQSQDAMYLECYHAWSNIAGEKHFDPHATEAWESEN